MEFPTNPPGRPDRSTILRYAAFQVPGILVVVTLALAGVMWFDWNPRIATGAAVLWVLKDIAMFPWVWRAYAPSVGGANELLGRTATVETPLAPNGRVRVGSERWRAAVSDGEADVEAGVRVRIVGISGLELEVVRAPSEGEPTTAVEPADPERS